MPEPIAPLLRMMRADEWAAKITGVGQEHVVSTSRISVELVRYQQLPANHVVARKSSLMSMKAICDTVRVEPGTPLCEALVSLKLDVAKALSTIEKARKAWASARKIFGGVGRGNGNLRALRNHSFEHLELGQVAGDGNYWLEALDPVHRPWALQSALEEGEIADPADPATDYILGKFVEWGNDASIAVGFFEWMNTDKYGPETSDTWAYGDYQEMGLAPKLEYMSGSHRSRNRCVFEDKKIQKLGAEAFKPGGLLENRKLDLQPLSTRELMTAFSGKGFAAFVCSQFGAFYTANHEVGKFHHSSFLSGESVLAAGEWCVSDGRLLVITNKSGHYQTTNANLVNALKLLDKRLNLTTTVVAVPDFASSSGAVNYYKAQDFVRASGIETGCAKTALASGEDIIAEAIKRCAARTRFETSDFATAR